MSQPGLVRHAVILGVLLSLPALGAGAAEEIPPLVTRPTKNPGLKLLYEGKIDEASRLLGFGELGGAHLLRNAKRAHADGEIADALGLYETYLRFLPFRWVSWEDYLQAQWSEAAIAYIRLLAETEKPDAEWFRQSLAALKPYEALRRAYAAKDASEHGRLAEEILVKYPRGIFPQAAVMTTCWGRDVGGHGERPKDISELYRGYLAQMSRLGIPEEQRLLVTLLYESRLNHQEYARHQGKFRVVSATDILRLSKHPFLRRAYLSRDLLGAKDQLEARARGWQYLAEFPASAQTAGRMNLIRTYLAANDPAEALWWLDQWERPAAPEALLEVADHYSRQHAWGKAIQHYEETVRSHPNSRHAVLAKLQLARAFGAKGDDVQMVALLKEIATAPPGDTRTHLMDASNTRNAAHEALAEHFMQHGDWQQALHWWERWEPTSWCGTCAEAMQKMRADKIEECRQKLPPNAP